MSYGLIIATIRIMGWPFITMAKEMSQYSATYISILGGICVKTQHGFQPISLNFVTRTRVTPRASRVSQNFAGN